MRETYTGGVGYTQVLDKTNHILNPVRIFEFRDESGTLKYRHFFGSEISFPTVVADLQEDLDKHNLYNEEKLTWKNVREVLCYGETSEL